MILPVIPDLSIVYFCFCRNVSNLLRATA